MSELLGNKIPDNILSIVSPDTERRINTAVFLITKDMDNFPRAAMLSPYQICSVSDAEFLFSVYSGSNTAGNLKTNGIALFIFQEGGGVTYVRCRSAEVKGHKLINSNSEEILFIASDLVVTRDFSEKAKITSVTLFDESSVMENYIRTFSQIREIAKGWKG